ncbi:MAG: DUF177 domain-containing protein [Anaerolineales bacterium]|nr:DUF177 domain-containing protein [Anaerolineales bacterium]
MPSPKKPFRINVGFIAHEEIGRNHDFPFEFNKIKLGDDFELRDFAGNVNIGRTPQGLVVQADCAADIDLQCVRCLTDFEYNLEWSFTELYAFDDRSETDAELILPEDAHIDLAELMRDYALLEIPFSPICSPECQGLCIECGQNLNEKDCGHGQDDGASPFSALKDLL